MAALESTDLSIRNRGLTTCRNSRIPNTRTLCVNCHSGKECAAIGPSRLITPTWLASATTTVVLQHLRAPLWNFSYAYICSVRNTDVRTLSSGLTSSKSSSSSSSSSHTYTLYKYHANYDAFTTHANLFGPFYGAIAVPSVTRCRCCCCCGHRFYIAIDQVSLLSHAACAIAI